MYVDASCIKNVIDDIVDLYHITAGCYSKKHIKYMTRLGPSFVFHIPAFHYK